MSRIEDEREAARLTEQLALKKRQEEARAERQRGSDSAFSKLVQQSAKGDAESQRKAIARSVIGQLKKDHEQASKADEGHFDQALSDAGAQEHSTQELGQAAQASRAQHERLASGERHSNDALAADAARQLATDAREQGKRSDTSAARGRATDARADRGAADERQAGLAKGARPQGATARDKGELKSDAEKKNSRGGKQEPGKDAAAGFRLNPALFAPVPVAQAKATAGADRLRSLAAEIAQKIVERVRVGTNAEGKSEFQIELRSEVLSGLSIKVSSSNGKIRAVFSGADREVLKLLRGQQEALKAALGGRGLTLESCVIEERR